MTFDDLRSEVLSWMDEPGAAVTSSSYLNAGAALKQSHTIRLTEDPWKFMLWPRQETFLTRSGIQTYALHSEFLRPYSVRNSTQKLWLTETPGRNIERAGVDWDTDQDTGRFSFGGRWPVAIQPNTDGSGATTSVVLIRSSSASDTGGGPQVIITGTVDFGGSLGQPSYVASETLTATGITDVTSTTSFQEILSITKVGTWVGSMTLRYNSGQTGLILLPSESGRSYPTLQLLYLPTSGETIAYRFYRRPSATFGDHDEDVPDVPPPFERILVFDALLLMGAYDGRLDPARAGVWTRMRDDLDFQLRQASIEGQTLGAEGRFISERSNLTFVRMP